MRRYVIAWAVFLFLLTATMTIDFFHRKTYENEFAYTEPLQVVAAVAGISLVLWASWKRDWIERASMVIFHGVAGFVVYILGILGYLALADINPF